MKRIPTQERFPRFREDQREFFDELSVNDWQFNDFDRMEEARQFEIDRLFRIVSPRRILDVGCGTGGQDLAMASSPNVEEVVGVDYSDKSVELANRVYPNAKVRRYVADLFALPPSNFDLAVSFQVIEHVTDPLTFLKACKGQVRPGGWVAAFTPNRERAINRLFKLFGRLPVLEDPQHFLEYTPQELSRIGAIAGLSTIDSFSYGFDISSATLRATSASFFPHYLSLRLGFLLPSMGNRFCIVFQR